MILTAKEVRYMSDNYYANKLTYLMKCIKNSSYSGNYDVTINEEISKETISKLEELGYVVDHVRNKFIIRW